MTLAARGTFFAQCPLISVAGVSARWARWWRFSWQERNRRRAVRAAGVGRRVPQSGAVARHRLARKPVRSARARPASAVAGRRHAGQAAEKPLAKRADAKLPRGRHGRAHVLHVRQRAKKAVHLDNGDASRGPAKHPVRTAARIRSKGKAAIPPRAIFVRHRQVSFAATVAVSPRWARTPKRLSRVRKATNSVRPRTKRALTVPVKKNSEIGNAAGRGRAAAAESGRRACL